jgi:hypothetical protein
VGTLGRSIWILDDLTPVRELTPEIVEMPAHLFTPLDATQRHAPAKWGSRLGSRDGAGENAPVGALISYWLAEKPEEPITLEVLDADGRVVRTLSSVLETPYTPPEHPDWDPQEEREPDLATEPGLNRAVWDLHHEKSDWVVGTRSEAGGRVPGPRALPGSYTLRLTVDGQTRSRPLRVEADPASTASRSDLEAQLEFELGLRDRISEIATMVRTIRSIRSQIEAHNERLAGRDEAVELISAGETLAADLLSVEEELHSPHAEVGYDVLAGREGGAKLLSRLGWLASGAADHDGPPTQGMVEVEREIGRRLAEQRQRLDRLVADDLAALNARAAESGLSYVMSPGP